MVTGGHLDYITFRECDPPGQLQIGHPTSHKVGCLFFWLQPNIMTKLPVPRYWGGYLPATLAPS